MLQVVFSRLCHMFVYYSLQAVATEPPVCGSSYLKPYSTATCNMTVTHNERDTCKYQKITKITKKDRKDNQDC